MRLLAAAVAAASLLALPQDPVQPETLKRAQQLAETGEAHRRLGRLVGSFDVALETTPPGEAARADRGTVVGKAILGGRYVVLNFLLELQGQPLEAVQILGYDNLRQQYTASWRDDHSTWAVDCAGEADPEAPGRIEMRGVLRDARDPNGRPYRLVLTLPAAADGEVTVAIHDTLDGVEYPLQTQRWTRR